MKSRPCAHPGVVQRFDETFSHDPFLHENVENLSYKLDAIFVEANTNTLYFFSGEAFSCKCCCYGLEAHTMLQIMPHKPNFDYHIGSRDSSWLLSGLYPCSYHGL